MVGEPADPLTRMQHGHPVRHPVAPQESNFRHHQDRLHGRTARTRGSGLALVMDWFVKAFIRASLLWFAAVPSMSSLLGAGICLATRMASGVYLEGRLDRELKIASVGLAVLKDLLQVVIWALAFTGRQVTWRGEDFKVESEGKLVRVASRSLPISAASAKLQSEPE